ncbi:uncharacterized protein LOC129745426 [Uranotaenia lowii]|uniref:uncharacterized protein LOC129745426 n=1 Tax=Uranotaenia lowii TaxID=190385 RepID=UPI002478A71C|nr:uncharacterized protein LOC129745426 [Uranotaenia lowii]
MSRTENYLALCLLDAVEDQNLDSMRALLEHHKANPNVMVLDRNVAPVHLVIGMENVTLAETATRLMMEHGADPNLRSQEEGMTPLHVAAHLGRAGIVQCLLKFGGDLGIRDDDRKTPIEYAIEEGHFEVIKVMQNWVFEQKFEQKRQRVIMDQQQNANGGYIKCLGGYLRVTTPTKNCLSTIQKLDENKLTPNRIHYNFDATSPYYINITHRNKQTKAKRIDNISTQTVPLNQTEQKEELIEIIESPDEDDNIVVGRKNLFELTERNLANFSRNMTNSGRRSSFIECWRDKIAALRDRNKLSTKLEDIERILSGISDTSFHETILDRTVEDQSPGSHGSPPRSPESDQNSSFKTAVEHVAQKLEDSLRTNEFALVLCPSPEAPSIKVTPPTTLDRIVQITEEYVHTDDEAGLVFYEKKFLTVTSTNTDTAEKRQRNPSMSSQSTAITLPPLDYDTDALRAELTNFGEPPGPITVHTKKLYLKKLVKFKRDPERALAALSKDKKQTNYSVELQASIRREEVFRQIAECGALEQEMSTEFTTANDKTWREGHLKKSFIYLLIDPRISENLPAQQNIVDRHDLWKRFLQSIFYVGKGKSSRPYCHLYDAMKLYHQKSAGKSNLQPPPATTAQLQIEEEKIIFQSEDRIERFCRTAKILNRKQMNDSQKLNRIIDIWRSQHGVICLHVFHNIMPAEAYTREAAIIDAIGIHNLTNLKRGDYYGKTLSWPMKRRKQLGILLLYKAMLIFLAEGETQLLPSDLI